LRKPRKGHGSRGNAGYIGPAILPAAREEMRADGHERRRANVAADLTTS
jgi:hypothetical protein